MKKIVLVILLVMDILLLGTVYSNTITNEISSKLLRMHIISNSNSQYDQEIKLRVRDLIIVYIDKNKIDSKENVKDEIKNIEEKVNVFLDENDVNYCCRVSVADSHFDTKKYNNLEIPKGNYESLKVVLGNGDGRNWWCVAYPPLCFTESVIGDISKEGEEELKKTLQAETYNIIKNEKTEFKIKFKIIEVINSLF